MNGGVFITVTSKVRFALLFAVLLAILTISISIVGSYYPSRSNAPSWFASPILWVETPRDDSDLKHALGDGETNDDTKASVRWVIKVSTVLDFPFIVAYAGFIFLFASWAANNIVTPHKISLSLSQVLILTAALADVGEDVYILLALKRFGAGGSVDGLSMIIRSFALLKWGCFYFSILLISFLLYRTIYVEPFGQPYTGILAITLFLSGVIGLLGLQADARAHLQEGALLFAAAPLFSIGFLGKAVVRDYRTLSLEERVPRSGG